MMINGPCKNCPDRHAACWSDCERFLEYKEKTNAIKSARIKEMSLDRFKIDGVRKARAMAHKRRKN